MRRSVLAPDRIAAVVLGLALFAAGIAAAGWYTGALRRLWPAFPKRLSTAGFSDVLNTHGGRGAPSAREPSLSSSDCGG